MYTGGKNQDQSFLMGTAYIGYDCSEKILCVAAHLNFNKVDSCSVLSDTATTSNNWVTIDDGTPPPPPLPRYTQFSSSKVGFAYVMYPDGGEKIIGKC